MTTEKANDLATVHFNRKLDTFDAYINLAESCFRLRDEAEPLLPSPHCHAAFQVIDDVIRAGLSKAGMLLRLADQEIAEFDGALRGYGYRTYGSLTFGVGKGSDSLGARGDRRGPGELER